MTSTCAYGSYPAQVYHATHFIPWIVPLAIAAAAIGRTRYNTWGTQLMLKLFGLWLTVLQPVLYIVQGTFNIQRPDPYCPDTFTFAFPLSEAFYIAALATFIIMFTYCWNIVLPWLYWFVLICFIIGPPGILCWYTYSTWAETLLSLGMGALTSIVFVVFVRFLILDDFPLLLNQRPWTWLGSIDNYAMTTAAQEESERVRIVLKRLERQGLA